MSHQTEKILRLKNRCGRSSVPSGWLCEAVAYNMDGSPAWEQTVVLPDALSWLDIPVPSFYRGFSCYTLRAQQIDWLVSGFRWFRAFVIEEQDPDLTVRVVVEDLLGLTEKPGPTPVSEDPTAEEQAPRWRVESFADSEGHTGYQIMDGDDLLVGMQHGNGWTDNQMRAMLTMMAAAPQMLEALEDVDSAGFVECCCGETTCCGSCTATLIKEAIKAATSQDIEQPHPAVSLLQRSELKRLSRSKLLDRFHDLRRQLDEVMSEMADRWLAKEEKE